MRKMYSCLIGGIGPYHDMDTISMLLTGWVIFIVCSVALLKYLYIRFVKKGNFSSELEASLDSNLLRLNEQKAEEEDELASLQDGTAVTKKVVETISGLKALPSSNKPQAPVRRRRIDKSAAIDSFDEIAALNASGPCTGNDPDVVEFINKCYEWGFNYKGTQKRAWEDMKEAFTRAVNKTLRDEDLKNDLTISVVDFELKDDLKLTNIFAECIHRNHIKVTSDCELQVKGELTVCGKDGGLRRCQFFVDRLCGRLSTLFECEEKSAIIKLDGWPEICVGISNSPSSTNLLDTKLSEAIGDRMTSAIRNSIVDIDHSQFQDFPNPPKCSPKKQTPPTAPNSPKKYLLVKVVKGSELGTQKGCEEPYCAIELDEPPQKFQTDAVRSQHPVWNENFVFNIVPGSGEILFEVFDKVGTRFLGCNIISVEEVGLEKTRVLPLKSRRMEISDQISGTLEVQFTLLDEKEFLQKSRDNSEKISSNGNLIKTTRAVYTRSPDAKSSTFAEHVIKEFERKALPNAEKSTLIIHAVQRDSPAPNSSSRPVVKIEKLLDGSYQEVQESDDDQIISRKERLKNEDNSTGIEGQYGDERGRRKTRKGDIFTSIRRRFSKGRSHSVVSGDGGVDNESKESKSDIFQRSVSADRQSMLSARLGLASARSSTSELSGISGFSTSTFVHDNSTLVIECTENRVRKYYLVPPNLAETGKWRKKGKKLHIYNDHSFVAKHLPSGTLCEICTTRLPFSLGKQGYQCRDCKMTCHKECHIRAPSFCPKTTIYDIELGTVKNVEESNKNSSPSIFSSLFGGKKSNANTNNKDSLSESTNNHSNNVHVSSKKKKSSIFRKVTKLGKISEENLASRERLNGDVKNPVEITEKTEQSLKEPEPAAAEQTKIDTTSKNKDVSEASNQMTNEDNDESSSALTTVEKEEDKESNDQERFEKASSHPTTELVHNNGPIAAVASVS